MASKGRTILRVQAEESDDFSHRSLDINLTTFDINWYAQSNKHQSILTSPLRFADIQYSVKRIDSGLPFHFYIK